MKEIMDIVSTLKNNNIKKAVLATVVKIKGSTYRRPGARMLVTEDGAVVGGISGGCLEEDVKEKAQEVFFDKKTVVVIYDMMSDDDIVWGLGLGCNGAVHVLLEYIENIPPDLIFAAQNYEHDNDFLLATIFAVKNVPEMYPGYKEFSNGALIDNDFWNTVSRLQPGIINKKKSSTVDDMPFMDGQVSFLLERIKTNSLAVFGAGFDAFPIVEFAKKIGWRITLYDYREGYLTRNRFPNVDEMIVLKTGKAEAVIADKNISVCIIMTHHYEHDLEILKALLKKQLSYIGMLGPVVRRDKIWNDIEKQGVSISREQKEKIYGPVGLDIGSEIPEEIAIAVLAEMLAVKNGRTGQFLRSYTGSIH